ncbi:aldehyde dehydrogenase [Pseudonocardia sp. C8]|nr:aldehyde dehydrogenase [Pseudonocardia sp. C8]MBC3191783.1 aldehyde dehydrogenase [Pseudonocardia sp. C8]
MLIGGEWVDSRTGDRFDSVDPYTGTTWASVPSAGPDDVDRAVRAARSALDGPWGALTATARGRLVRRLGELLARHADELGAVETTDNGKLLREMVGQVRSLPDWYDYYGGLADKIEGTTPPDTKPSIFAYTRPEPVGVVGAIAPWNSPLLITTLKLAPALAAGCTFVVKPSEHTPVSTLEFARLVDEAGIPPGVVNVVTGDGVTGRALAAHPGVDKVAFTGSSTNGVNVMKSAAEHVARVTLELGGKSPNVVFADADLAAAANGVIAGVFAATGQSCNSGSRLLVERSVHDELVARVAERARTIRMGDPRADSTEMGPIAFAQQLDKVLHYVDLASTEGATVHCGGRRPGDGELAGGYFYEPTILTGVRNDMQVAQEEIFGPVLSVIPFDSEDEALRIANDTRYGLAAGIWTDDVRRAHRVAHRVKAGMVWINCYRTISYNVPIGGFKHSGIGREGGIDAVREYTETKAVWVNMSDQTRDPFVVG